jgi:hypothetical protein
MQMPSQKIIEHPKQTDAVWKKLAIGKADIYP